MSVVPSSDLDGRVEGWSYLVAQVERRTARRVEAVLVGSRLSLDQWRAIDLLADGQGRTMSELGASLVVPGPTMTKLVDRLVEATLVFRVVDDRDRRRVVVRLSDEGVALQAQLRGRVREVERSVLAGLGDDAVAFVALLERLEREGAPTEPDA